MDDRIEALLARMQPSSLNVIDLKLERVEAFLALLGSPQKRLPPVIHVAGTNGKGSLIACLDAIFKAAGYKVHRYTSPHLVRFNERIQLGGKPIEDGYLEELLTYVAKFINRQPVTIFESTTAAAFLAFSQTPADVLLLETGMGGRLDATNVIDRPALTAITPISRDHCQFLGNSITDIAGEKAGIMKAHVPCVVGRQTSEAAHVINYRAEALGAQLYRMDHEWQVNGEMYESSYRSLLLQPSLAGRHQYDNAATAIACIEQLLQFPVSDAHMAQGIGQAVWPARLQKLNKGRLPDILPPGIELWLDGGHNPQGGEMLAQWLSAQYTTNIYLVCGMAQGKESLGFLKPLAPYAKQLFAVAFESGVQSQPAEELQQSAIDAGMDAAVAASVENALQTIARHAKTPAIVCICGSLYLAGQVLADNGE